MSRWQKSMFVVGMALIFTGTANAVPAAPVGFVLTQPDGATFEAVRRGDEWFNWFATASGYPVAKAEDGFYYYVDTRQPPPCVKGRPKVADDQGDVLTLTPVRADLPAPDYLSPNATPPRPESTLPAR